MTIAILQTSFLVLGIHQLAFTSSTSISQYWNAIDLLKTTPHISHYIRQLSRHPIPGMVLVGYRKLPSLHLATLAKLTRLQLWSIPGGPYSRYFAFSRAIAFTVCSFTELGELPDHSSGWKRSWQPGLQNLRYTTSAKPLFLCLILRCLRKHGTFGFLSIPFQSTSGICIF